MTDITAPTSPSQENDPESPEQASDDGSPTDGDRSTATEPGASPQPAKRSIWQRLVRYVLLLVLLACLAAAALYATPIFNDRIVQPVETNAADTAALQTSVENSTARIDQLETDAASLRAELVTTNADLVSITETAASNTARIDDIDALITDQTSRLDALDDLAATLEIEIQTQGSSTALQVEFLKSTELLSRARLFLYQANYGLAEQDVQAARDILSTLLIAQDEDTPVDTINLASALSRIDLVLDALPGRPVAASDDLDIAWRLLLDDPLSPLLATTNPTDGLVDPTTPPTSGVED